MYNNFTVLGGEPAVPYTRNPLQRGRKPPPAYRMVGRSPFAERWYRGLVQCYTMNRVRAWRQQH